MTTTNSPTKIDCVTIVFNLDGEALKAYADHQAAVDAVDEPKFIDGQVAAFYDSFKAQHTGASHVSRVLGKRFQRSHEMRYYRRSEGFIVENGADYISVGYALGDHDSVLYGTDGAVRMAKAAERLNEQYQALYRYLREQGFVAIVQPARARAWSLTTGQVIVVGKAVEA